MKLWISSEKAISPIVSHFGNGELFAGGLQNSTSEPPALAGGPVLGEKPSAGLGKRVGEARRVARENRSRKTMSGTATGPYPPSR